jgi:hypothetical protein
MRVRERSVGREHLDGWWGMKILGCVLAIAGLLAGCASTPGADEQTGSFQSAVYIVGDSAAPVEAMPQADVKDSAADTDTDDSAIRRLYWFFAGR